MLADTQTHRVGMASGNKGNVDELLKPSDTHLATQKLADCTITVYLDGRKPKMEFTKEIKKPHKFEKLLNINNDLVEDEMAES